jgi:hypothetical protein
MPRYPAVQLEVTCELTLTPAGALPQGDFDLVLLKREPERSGRGGASGVIRDPVSFV